MRLLAVDGNSIVNRAFYGIRPLTTKDGQFTNAIYGFLTMLYKIKNEENPDAVAIAFDLKHRPSDTRPMQATRQHEKVCRRSLRHKWNR